MGTPVGRERGVTPNQGRGPGQADPRGPFGKRPGGPRTTGDPAGGQPADTVAFLWRLYLGRGQRALLPSSVALGDIDRLPSAGSGGYTLDLDSTRQLHRRAPGGCSFGDQAVPASAASSRRGRGVPSRPWASPPPAGSGSPPCEGEGKGGRPCEQSPAGGAVGLLPGPAQQPAGDNPPALGRLAQLQRPGQL